MTGASIRAIGGNELYPLDLAPPLGVVPARMHAWTVREDRFGEPLTSFRQEIVPTWTAGPGEVLVRVMAAGVNYNGVWAGLGKPVSVLKRHGHGLVTVHVVVKA